MSDKRNRFLPEVRARAVRMVLEHEAEYSSRLKAMLRKARERTLKGLWNLIGKLVDIFQPNEGPTTSVRANMNHHDRKTL